MRRWRMPPIITSSRAPACRKAPEEAAELAAPDRNGLEAGERGEIRLRHRRRRPRRARPTPVRSPRPAPENAPARRRGCRARSAPAVRGDGGSAGGASARRHGIRLPGCGARRAEAAVADAAHEIDHLHDQRLAAEHGRDVLDALHQRALVREQPCDRRRAACGCSRLEAAAAQADEVQAAEPRAIADRRAVGDQSLIEPERPPRKACFADAHPLVHGREAAEDRMIADRHMAREGRIVDQDHVIADAAVVRDMGADHDQAAIADGGDHAAPSVPGFDRHLFADDGLPADHDLARFALELEDPAADGRSRRRGRPWSRRRSR